MADLKDSEILIRQANPEDSSGIHLVLRAAFEEYREYYTEEEAVKAGCPVLSLDTTLVP